MCYLVLFPILEEYRLPFPFVRKRVVVRVKEHDGFVSLVTTGWGGPSTVLWAFLGILNRRYVGHSKKRVKKGRALQTS